MKIEIGVVLKPQGVNGELKVSRLCDGEKALSGIKTLTLGDAEYSVLRIKERADALYVSLNGVFDRNAAELLRGKTVYAEKEELKRESGAYFIADLIGSALYLSSGKKIGIIRDVVSSNVDVFVLETDEGEASLPFLKILNPVVDEAEKKITVDAKKFTEVVFYKENA